MDGQDEQDLRLPLAKHAKFAKSMYQNPEPSIQHREPSIQHRVTSAELLICKSMQRYTYFILSNLKYPSIICFPFILLTGNGPRNQGPTLKTTIRNNYKS